VSLVGVLALGIEAGLVLAIVWTLLGHLWRTGHPHIAVVGRVRHTEHFRNVLRHEVETWPELLLIRVDEDLYFANAGFVEDFIAAETARHPQARHLVLIASAINHIDATALEMLTGLAKRLRAAGVVLHLAEVKGPVMDGLKRSDLLAQIAPGRVFFRTEDAIEDLAA
jgi:SulP family sulfate permease